MLLKKRLRSYRASDAVILFMETQTAKREKKKKIKGATSGLNCDYFSLEHLPLSKSFG